MGLDSQEERLQKWKEHFKNLFKNSPEITIKLTLPQRKIINGQLDMKLGQFTEEKLDAVLKKITSRKTPGFNKILSEVWKTRKYFPEVWKTRKYLLKYGRQEN